MISEGFHPKQAYRVLRLIFYSLNTGLLIFFIVGIYLNGIQVPAFKEGVDILTIASVLLLGAIPAGYMISARRMAAIDPADPFARKFEQFQTAMIIRWAMIEGAALFSLVGLILLHDAKQLVIFLLCVVVLSLNSVNKERVIRMAKMNHEEARLLDE
jgi:F0F1-type ATP synthase membrane subunit c/vacuolar-type H+-ATPase subunit K